MAMVRDPNEHFWSGNHTFSGNVYFPDGAIDDQSVKSAANLSHTKLQHRIGVRHSQPGTVVAAAENVYCAYAPATVVSFKCEIDTIATGADREITVDVKKSTGGGAFASICTPKVLDDGSTARTVYDITLTGTPTLVEDDVLQVVVTVTGSAGAQGIGLMVYGSVAEDGT